MRPMSSRPNANVSIEKNVPLDKTFVILYVIALLDEYERSIKMGKKPLIDPYREKILIKTENGKYAIIPEEVQQYAIKQWVSAKGITKGKPNYNNSDDDDDDEDESLTYVLFKLIFYLLVIFLVLYVLNLLRLNNTL
jgi:hypothetical protein